MVENVAQAEPTAPAPTPQQAGRIQDQADNEGGVATHAEDIYFRRRLPQPTNPPPLDHKGTLLDTVI